MGSKDDGLKSAGMKALLVMSASVIIHFTIFPLFLCMYKNNRGVTRIVNTEVNGFLGKAVSCLTSRFAFSLENFTSYMYM